MKAVKDGQMAPAVAFILAIIRGEQKDIPAGQLNRWRADWARLGATGTNTPITYINLIRALLQE